MFSTAERMQRSRARKREEVVTVPEMASELGLSVSGAYHLIYSGHVRPLRFCGRGRNGTVMRVPISEVIKHKARMSKPKGRDSYAKRIKELARHHRTRKPRFDRQPCHCCSDRNQPIAEVPPIAALATEDT